MYLVYTAVYSIVREHEKTFPANILPSANIPLIFKAITYNGVEQSNDVFLTYYDMSRRHHVVARMPRSIFLFLCVKWQ